MKIRDMTKGDEKRIIFSFCVPLVVSCVCQQLYSVADGIIVGRFVSDNVKTAEDALAAVGVTAPVTLIFIAVATGISVGLTVLVSHLFGSRDHANIKPAVFTGMMSSLAVGALLTSLCLIFTDQVLDILNTPAEIYGDSRAYLQIYLAGTLFVFVYYVCSAAFSALGDSKTPLLLIVGSSLLNVALDLAFVPGLKMGVKGAAWATVASQAASCGAALILLVRRLKFIRTVEEPKLWSPELLKRLSVLSVPSVIQQSAVAVGNFFIQSVVNDYGTSAEIAGFFAALKVNSLAVMSFRAIGDGISAFTAQNFGAGEKTRMKRGLAAGLELSAFLALPVAAVYLISAPGIIGLFLSEESAGAISAGAHFIRWVSPFYAVIVIKVMLDGMFRGIGRMKLFMASTLADLFLRVGLVYAFAPLFSLDGIGYAWDIGWVAATLLASAFYMRLRKAREI